MTWSQAARQSLAMLIASAVVVLKHATSTLRQRHNSISIDLTFSVSDNVREVTSPEKVGSRPMSGRDATWGQHIQVLWFLFLYSSTELQPVNQFSRTIAQKTPSGVRKTHFGIRIVLLWNLVVFYPKNTPTNWSQRAIARQNKMSNNSEAVRDTRNVSMNHDYETGVASSDSVNKTYMKRPVAEKSRWRHIRLAIKLRYLGNHASQINSY